MKNLIVLVCLIFLISSTAVIKTSSKKIEEEIFILRESLSILKEKKNLVLFEHTYLSNPSRLIKIMKNDENESYIHLEVSDLQTLSESQGLLLLKDTFKND